MDVFHIFLSKLFLFLTQLEPTAIDLNIFRRQNNRLVNGDLCFPLTIGAWKKYLNSSTTQPISMYINDSTVDFRDLISTSNTWQISVLKCNLIENKVYLFLNRLATFEYVLNSIFMEKENYGKQKLNFNNNIEIHVDTFETLDLTQLRMQLIQTVINNLLSNQNESSVNSEIIYLTNKSNFNHKYILCGEVICKKNGIKTHVTPGEIYNKRMIDMRLMAQHKYGVRVNSDAGWQDFFQKLGNAAVIFDLIHVKINRPLIIHFDHPSSTHGKGASFILYNCARLAKIFEQFEKNIESNLYPTLPNFEDIDLSLLKQPEEWELLYVYLLDYPTVITNCIKDIPDCKLNIHYFCIYLDSLCSLFSVYYRRVRILTEPRPHMLPVLYARVYLLKAVQQVLHNALSILNISPVKQM